MFAANSLKKAKQRFGEFEFEYFGGSDANKLLVCTKYVSQNFFSRHRGKNPVGNTSQKVWINIIMNLIHFYVKWEILRHFYVKWELSIDTERW